VKFIGTGQFVVEFEVQPGIYNFDFILLGVEIANSPYQVVIGKRRERGGKEREEGRVGEGERREFEAQPCITSSILFCLAWKLQKVLTKS
jgi:hypothetical protein